MSEFEQLRLIPAEPSSGGKLTPAAVAGAFDAARLTQARHLAGMTKQKLAKLINVTPAAVSQYELGTSRPRPDHVLAISSVLDVPIAFFVTGRPYGKLDASMAHFRSLRSTRSYQRAKAVALVEQVWEVTYALEKRVELPWVDLPGFSGAEVDSGVAVPAEARAAARAMRHYWGLGDGPVTHFVRRLESRGIVVFMPPPDQDCDTVDAFSTSRLPRPIIVITANRTDDVYRYRFTLAHELGHLVLHGDVAPGDAKQEREADIFAAEFLTPQASILPHLPSRVDMPRLVELQRTWGVSVKSLLYRSRELGFLSESAAGRGYQKLHLLADQPGFRPESVSLFPGEQSTMLMRAFELASSAGLTIQTLADELAWPIPKVRELVGIRHTRPVLSLLKGGG